MARRSIERCVSVLQPTLGVSSLDLGRPAGRPLFAESAFVHFRAARRSFASIGPVRSRSRPKALLGAAWGSYPSRSDSRADRLRLAGDLMHHPGFTLGGFALF